MSFFEQNQPSEQRKQHMKQKNHYLRVVCCAILAFLAIRMFFNTPEDNAIQPAFRFGVAAFILVASITIAVLSIRGRKRMQEMSRNASNADPHLSDPLGQDIAKIPSDEASFYDEASETDKESEKPGD